MKHWPLVAIALAWAIATGVIWESARHVERTQRFDGCTYVADLGPQPFWACPAEHRAPARPADPEL